MSVLASLLTKHGMYATALYKMSAPVVKQLIIPLNTQNSCNTSPQTSITNGILGMNQTKARVYQIFDNFFFHNWYTYDNPLFIYREKTPKMYMIQVNYLFAYKHTLINELNEYFYFL